MQNDFVLPSAPAVVHGALATVPRIKAVLEWFRAKCYPVFHIVREYRVDGSDIEISRREAFLAGPPYAVPGTKGVEIIDVLSPITGEYRVVKPRFSAFFGTELELILRRLGVDSVVVCGTQYPNCIRATAFDALSYGYPTTVITDATSASALAVAKSNIRDMEGIGIRCVSFDEFEKSPYFAFERDCAKANPSNACMLTP
ncbi:MAG: cysteine hydrolase [Ferrovum myxofaciens]|nr:MAG: cysteine hydrolase [Ferrovum myxofaciens]